MTAEKTVLKPAMLKAGDRVGLIAPGTRPESAASLARCVSLVEQIGFQPVVGKNVLNVRGFTAGTDEERLADLNGFIADDDIAAIFCLSGRAGSLHLLADVDYDGLTRRPKVIVGSEENTSLLTAINSRTGLVVFHGPNLERIFNQFTLDRYKAALTTSLSLLDTEGKSGFLRVNHACGELKVAPFAPVGGKREGTTLGGNLSAFVSLMGTPFEPDFKQALLLLDDYDEQNGILDRWMTTLYIAGKLDQVAGVAFGAFENCSTKKSNNMLSTVDTLAERVTKLKLPSCFGFPFGLTDKTHTVPIGIRALLDCDAGTLEILEPVFV